LTVFFFSISLSKNGEISPEKKDTGWMGAWRTRQVQVSTKWTVRLVRISGRVLKMSAAVPGQDGRGSCSVRQKQKNREEDTAADRTARRRGKREGETITIESRDNGRSWGAEGAGSSRHSACHG
jgi:hypothetical protein